jgi:FdhD protein
LTEPNDREEVEVTRFSSGAPAEVTDEIAREEPLEVRLNGITLVYLMRLPGDDVELAAGFCLSEGLITCYEQIDMVRYCTDGEGPSLSDEPGAPGNLAEITAHDVGESGRFEGRVVRTGCGGADLAGDVDLEGIRVESGAVFDPAILLKVPGLLEEGQPVFRKTGGTHGAGVFDSSGEMLVVREDVGRHNAVDKALGHLLLKGMSFDDKGLVLSGRLSYEMVLKAARAGVPLICSVSAPTSLGVQVGRLTGVTLVGFLRGDTFNVYSGPQRLGAA